MEGKAAMGSGERAGASEVSNLRQINAFAGIDAVFGQLAAMPSVRRFVYCRLTQAIHRADFRSSKFLRFWLTPGIVKNTSPTRFFIEH